MRKTSGKSGEIMRHLIMTPASLSASTPTLSTLHHQRMALQSQSQSPLASPLTPSPSSVFGSPKFPANYERSEKVSSQTKVRQLKKKWQIKNHKKNGIPTKREAKKKDVHIETDDPIINYSILFMNGSTSAAAACFPLIMLLSF